MATKAKLYIIKHVCKSHLFASVCHAPAVHDQGNIGPSYVGRFNLKLQENEYRLIGTWFG